jgi:hypothetical protein
MVGDVYEVRWPQVYLDFLSFFAVFAFDPFGAFGLDCFLQYDAHSAMYGLSAVLLALELGVVAGLVANHYVQQASGRAGYIRKFVAFQLLLTYFVYPFGCTNLFAMFDCITVDRVRYLRSDLAIDCDSDAHQTSEAFAGFMILAFPLGLPALYFAMLWSNRSHLFDTETGGGVSFLGFFFREYNPRFYYWETVECVRKCIIVGFASFYQPGSLMQLIAVMLLTVLYSIVLAICKPYDDPMDDTLAIMNQAMLFTTLLGALMLKIDQAFSSTGVYEEGYDMNVVNLLLLGSVATVALSAAVAVIRTATQFATNKGSGKRQSEDSEGERGGGEASSADEEAVAEMRQTKLVV